MISWCITSMYHPTLMFVSSVTSNHQFNRLFMFNSALLNFFLCKIIFFLLIFNHDCHSFRSLFARMYNTINNSVAKETPNSHISRGKQKIFFYDVCCWHLFHFEWDAISACVILFCLFCCLLFSFSLIKEFFTEFTPSVPQYLRDAVAVVSPSHRQWYIQQSIFEYAS